MIRIIMSTLIMLSFAPLNALACDEHLDAMAALEAKMKSVKDGRAILIEDAASAHTPAPASRAAHPSQPPSLPIPKPPVPKKTSPFP